MNKVTGFTPASDYLCKTYDPITALVYGKIWRYWDHYGKCSASISRIADELGIGGNTVVRKIKILEQAGYIENLRNGKDAGTTNIWIPTNKIAYRSTVEEIVNEPDRVTHHGLPPNPLWVTPSPTVGDIDSNKIVIKETDSSPEKAGEIEVDFFGGIEDDQPVSQPIRERKPKDKDGYSAVMESIEKEFALARGCDLPDWEHEPKATNKRWRMPLARMWKKANQDIVVTKTGVRAATKKLIESGMTFDAPDQIEKTFYSWLIDHKNGNGNGAIKEIIIAPVTDNRKTISDYQRIAITGD